MELSFTSATVTNLIKDNIVKGILESGVFSYATTSGDVVRISLDSGSSDVVLTYKDAKTTMPQTEAIERAIEVILTDSAVKAEPVKAKKEKSGGLTTRGKVCIGLGTVAVIGAAAAAYVMWPEATTEAATTLIGG